MERKIRKGRKRAQFYCRSCGYKHNFSLDESRDYEDHGVFQSDKDCGAELIVTYHTEKQDDWATPRGNRHRSGVPVGTVLRPAGGNEMKTTLPETIEMKGLVLTKVLAFAHIGCYRDPKGGLVVIDFTEEITYRAWLPHRLVARQSK